jgi:hypothetical protein
VSRTHVADSASSPLSRAFLKATLIRAARATPLWSLLVPPPDVYFLSYPKAGRTWLRAMVGKALSLRYGLTDIKVLDTYRLTRAAGTRLGRFDHEDAWGEHSYLTISADKSMYRRKRVVLIVRDVRDILVSSYFHATKRNGAFSGQIADFVRSDGFGARKIVTYYNHWYAQRGVPRELHLIRYEDVHADPRKALVSALAVLDADVGPGHIDDALAFGSFANLKKVESCRAIDDHRLQPGAMGDDESFKVRKGKIGGYAEYLSPDDIAYVDQVVRDHGCPFVQRTERNER